MSLGRDQGVVLRTWKLGEAHRIISLFTRDRGKIRAVAKGVRRTRSKFGARLEPASHVAVQLYEGRSELGIVTQAETLDRFAGLRSDLHRFAEASAMLEAVSQVAPDADPNPRLYEMLVRALRTLDEHGSELVLGAFFWKLLALEGFEPVVTECVSCGAEAGLCAFDPDEGGLLCSTCRRGRAVGPEAIELLQLVLGGRLAEALARPTSPATHEVGQLAQAALEHHLERRLRSLGVLEQT